MADWSVEKLRVKVVDTPIRILIVEDELKAATYLAHGLRESGYEADVAGDGAAALAAAESRDYGLIICDVMMPGRDGFSTVSEIRRLRSGVPIIFVSALDDVEARVHGLDIGADDYLVKPFSFAELLARVRALIRRVPSEKPAGIISIADLELDLRTHSVSRAGKKVELTPKEFALLLLLAEHAGEVVPRRAIAEQVWGMNFDSGTNIIDVQVRRLRAKIEPPELAPLIHTVRGVGYFLDHRGLDA